VSGHEEKRKGKKKGGNFFETDAFAGRGTCVVDQEKGGGAGFEKREGEEIISGERDYASPPIPPNSFEEGGDAVGQIDNAECTLFPPREKKEKKSMPYLAEEEGNISPACDRGAKFITGGGGMGEEERGGEIAVISTKKEGGGGKAPSSVVTGNMSGFVRPAGGGEKKKMSRASEFGGKGKGEERFSMRPSSRTSRRPCQAWPTGGEKRGRGGPP